MNLIFISRWIEMKAIVKTTIFRFVSVILSLSLSYAMACADELGQFAIGTRFVYLSPSAEFDNLLGGHGNDFSDDYKPDIFIRFYPTNIFSVEYSFLVSEHGFSFGYPNQVIGSTSLFTQTVSGTLHISPSSAFSPYMGGGLNILTPFSTKSSTDSFSIDDHIGWMVQSGIDFRISQNSWFNFDYRYLDLKTHARVNGALYRLNISPSAYSLGVMYRF